jgi:hypothetical protein
VTRSPFQSGGHIGPRSGWVDPVAVATHLRHVNRRFPDDPYLRLARGTAFEQVNMPRFRLGDPFDRPVGASRPVGRLLLFVGSGGSGPGEFLLPAGLYVDNNDRIYVADQGNSRVQVFQYLRAEATGTPPDVSGS